VMLPGVALNDGLGHSTRNKHMPCYIVDTTYGRTVVEDISLRCATARALREHGTKNYKGCHKATISELIEVKRSGGWLPTSVRSEVEAAEAAGHGR